MAYEAEPDWFGGAAVAAPPAAPEPEPDWFSVAQQAPPQAPSAPVEQTYSPDLLIQQPDVPSFESTYSPPEIPSTAASDQAPQYGDKVWGSSGKTWRQMTDEEKQIAIDVDRINNEKDPAMKRWMMEQSAKADQERQKKREAEQGYAVDAPQAVRENVDNLRAKSAQAAELQKEASTHQSAIEANKYLLRDLKQSADLDRERYDQLQQQADALKAAGRIDEYNRLVPQLNELANNANGSAQRFGNLYGSLNKSATRLAEIGQQHEIVANEAQSHQAELDRMQREEPWQFMEKGRREEFKKQAPAIPTQQSLDKGLARADAMPDGPEKEKALALHAKQVAARAQALDDMQKAAALEMTPLQYAGYMESGLDLDRSKMTGGSVTSNILFRGAETGGQMFFGGLGNILETIKKEAGSETAESRRKALNQYMQGWQRAQEEMDKKSWLGSTAGLARNSMGMLGEVTGSSILPGGFLGYVTTKSVADHLRDADERGITGSQKYNSALIHGMIDAGSMYFGGKILGAPLQRLGGIGGEFADTVAGKAIEAVTRDFNLSKPLRVLANAAGEANSQVMLGAGMTIAHYQADVAEGKRKFDANELAKMVLDEIPQNLVTGAVFSAVHGITHTLKERQAVMSDKRRLAEFMRHTGRLPVTESLDESMARLEASKEALRTRSIDTYGPGAIERHPPDTNYPKSNLLYRKQMRQRPTPIIPEDQATAEAALPINEPQPEPTQPPAAEVAPPTTTEAVPPPQSVRAETPAAAESAPPAAINPESAPETKPTPVETLYAPPRPPRTPEDQLPDWVKNDLTSEPQLDENGIPIDDSPPPRPKGLNRKEKAEVRRTVKELREKANPNDLDRLLALKIGEQRHVIDIANQMYGDQDRINRELKRQFKDIIDSGKSLARKAQKIKGQSGKADFDETKVSRYDFIAERLNDPKYSELRSYTESLGYGDVGSGIAPLIEGQIGQFDSRLHEHLGDALDVYESQRAREAGARGSGVNGALQEGVQRGNEPQASGEARPLGNAAEAPQAEQVAEPFALSREASPPPPTKFESTPSKQPDLIPDMWRDALPGQQGLFEGKAAEQPAPAKTGRPALTAADLSENIKAAATSPEEADALTSLVHAFAEYRGETPDEYVSQHIAGVEKTDVRNSKYLKQHGDKPAPGTIGPGGDVLAMAGGKRTVRGETQFLKDGRAIIRAFKDGQNVATIAHELGHVFRRTLLPEELAKAERSIGVENGKWKREHEERFARMFERYLYDGKAPNKALRSVFEKFKDWLSTVYRNLSKTAIAKEVPPELREVFDKMLGGKGVQAGEAGAPSGEGTLFSESPPGYKYGGREQTSLKNAVTAEERANRELPPVAEPEPQSTDQWDTAAKAALKRNPEAARPIIADVLEKPRQLSPVENAILLNHQQRLQNEYDARAREYIDAAEAGDTEAASALTNRLDTLSDGLLDTYNAGKKAGTEWGRAGVARQMMMNRDYSLAAMEARKRAALGGRQLTPDERQQLVKKSEEIAKLKEELKASEELAAQAAAHDAIDQMQKQAEEAKNAESPRVRSLAERIVTRLDSAANDALARFKARNSGRLSSGIDPRDLADLSIYGAAKIGKGLTRFVEWSAEMLRDVGDFIEPHLKQIWEAADKHIDAKIDELIDKPVAREKVKRAIKGPSLETQATMFEVGEKSTPAELSRAARELARYYIDRGVTDREEVFDRVHAELSKQDKSLSRRETMDAISLYGQTTELSKDPTAVRLREIAGEAQQLAKLQDMAAGMAPKKTGQERRTPTDTEREYIKLVNEAKKKGGYTVTDPAKQLASAFSAAKTRLRNQIVDLDAQIAKGEKTIKTKSQTNFTPDQRADLDSLMAERDKAKARFDAIFGKPGLTDAQRLEMATKAVERSIAEYDRRIKENDFSTGREPLTSPQLDALKKQRDATKAVYEELRSHDPQYQASRAQRDLAAMQRRLAEKTATLTDRLARKDFAKRETTKKLGPYDQKTTELADKLAAVQEQFDNELYGHRFERKANEEIANLKNQIVTGEVAELTPRQKRVLTPEQRRLDVQRRMLRTDVKRLKEEQNRSTIGKLWQGSGILRLMQTTGEFSPVLRQGGNQAKFALGKALLGDIKPAKQFGWAVGKMFKAFMSDAYASEHDQQTFNNKLLGEMSDAGLGIKHEGEHISGAEETKLASFFDKPLSIKGNDVNLLSKFNRAARVFFNEMRVSGYEAMRLPYGDTITPEQAKSIAKLVNVATGYSSLGKGEAVADYMSAALYSPRNLMAGLRFAVGEPLWRSEGSWKTLFQRGPSVKKQIASYYAANFIGTAAMLYMGHLAGGDVELDPRSTDFLKIRFGNTRIDLMSGLSQITVFLSRVLSGKTKTAQGEVNSLTEGRFGAPDVWETATRFGRSKLSPNISLIVDLLNGRDINGQPVNASSLGARAFPITYQDIYQAMQEQGVPKGAAMGLLAVFGAGLQTYAPKEPKPGKPTKPGARLKAPKIKAPPVLGGRGK